ncbi:MAG: hypothetical protein DMF69_18830 [Acidobacteria bacterium]|nr:MAG: hypothetical protein DMF69_18830 [Acidobacteriota bacterium]
MPETPISGSTGLVSIERGFCALAIWIPKRETRFQLRFLDEGEIKGLDYSPNKARGYGQGEGATHKPFETDEVRGTRVPITFRSRFLREW